MQAFGFLKRFREALMRGVGVIYKYNICIYIYIYYIFDKRNITLHCNAP